VRLERAARRIRMLHEETEEFYQQARVSEQLCELRNMIAVAYLVVQCAQQRRESRGLHYTIDYPEARESEKRASLV
jgi:L-aspartate oxidase